MRTRSMVARRHLRQPTDELPAIRQQGKPLAGRTSLVRQGVEYRTFPHCRKLPNTVRETPSGRLARGWRIIAPLAMCATPVVIHPGRKPPILTLAEGTLLDS